MISLRDREWKLYTNIKIYANAEGSRNLSYKFTCSERVAYGWFSYTQAHCLDELDVYSHLYYFNKHPEGFFWIGDEIIGLNSNEGRLLKMEMILEEKSWNT